MNAYCPVCRVPQLAVGKRSIVVLHILYIPVLPIGWRTRWYCLDENHDIGAARPSRKSILSLGIGLCVFFILLSIISGISGEYSTEEAIGIASLAAIIGALLIRAKSSEEHLYYKVGNELVEPLKPDYCPVCLNALNEQKNSYCSSCKVKVITESKSKPEDAGSGNINKPRA